MSEELVELGLNLRVVDVDELTPHPRNYNQHSEHQVGELGQSLGDFGQYKNVVSWRDPDNGTMYTLAGHGLVEAAIARGDTRIAVNDRSDLTRAQAMALMFSDNFTTSADYDFLLLADIVTDLDFPADVPGLDDEVLAGILEMANAGNDFLGVAKDAKPNPRNLPIDVIFTQTFRASCCLAVAAGLKYGLQSTKEPCLYSETWPGHSVCFVDNDYFNYDHEKHLAIVQRTRPKYATVMDVMTERQCAKDDIAWYSLEQILDWARELEQYAENIVVIPKYDCLDEIPERYVLGYSVPTSHGGTPLPVKAFKGRRVHLLGGSWKAQLAHMAELGEDVVSIDNNHISRISQVGGAILPNGERRDLPAYGIDTRVNPAYIALAISIGNMAWAVNDLYKDRKRVVDLSDICQATLGDIDDIKETAKRYAHELGFVLRPALEAAVDRESLLYHPSGAFCHYRQRKDGMTVIYEICTPAEARGQGLAKAMIDRLKKPIRLKCPVDNASNAFYARIGFIKSGEEKGKKRRLNVWRLD